MARHDPDFGERERPWHRIRPLSAELHATRAPENHMPRIDQSDLAVETVLHHATTALREIVLAVDGAGAVLNPTMELPEVADRPCAQSRVVGGILLS